ncbi:MAG: prohibitin family protein [Spirochaetes bacterium]|nr:prohibitin family protein [Spirochaetota bacterium]
MSLKNNIILTIIIILFIFIFIMFVANPFVIIKYGEAVVVENRIIGTIRKITKPGFHFLVPFMEVYQKYNLKVQSYTMVAIKDEVDKSKDDALEVLTSDGQPAWLDISVLYRYDPEKLIDFHKSFNEKTFVENILRPILRSSIRNIISKYSSIELYSSNPEDIAKTLGKPLNELTKQYIGRIGIQNEIFETLKKELADKYIILDDFKIRNVKFSEMYQKAIEEKQIAQQQVEKAEREKQRIIIESEAYRESVLIKAKADSEAIALIGEMLRRYPNYITYSYVQKIADDIKIIITNEKAILNLSQFLTE